MWGAAIQPFTAVGGTCQFWQSKRCSVCVFGRQGWRRTGLPCLPLRWTASSRLSLARRPWTSGRKSAVHRGRTSAVHHGRTSAVHRVLLPTGATTRGGVRRRCTGRTTMRRQPLRRHLQRRLNLLSASRSHLVRSRRASRQGLPRSRCVPTLQLQLLRRATRRRRAMGRRRVAWRRRVACRRLAVRRPSGLSSGPSRRRVARRPRMHLLASSRQGTSRAGLA